VKKQPRFFQTIAQTLVSIDLAFELVLFLQRCLCGFRTIPEFGLAGLL
jgi:hypothetical protein